MKLTFSQQLTQRQTTVITAQLQQAIQLLQMGNAELERYIEQQSEDNPFLDLDKSKSGNSEPKDTPEPVLPFNRDNRIASGPDFSARSHSAGDDYDLISAVVQTPPPSLFAHVTAAADRLFERREDRILAQIFLDALEPSGWLDRTVESIAQSGQITQARAEAILALLQTIETAGLFARSLSECLRLQAKDKRILSPAFDTLLNNLPLLANGNLRGLLRVCGLSLAELRELLRTLRRFNPKPGTEFGADDAPARAPDLLVARGDRGEWLVDLNRSTLPTVVVNKDQAKRLSDGGKDVSDFVSERLTSANWLRRAVAHRNETTLKVGAEVVRRQSDFLEHGPAHIRPMVLRDVSDVIGVHESTVSRVTSGLMIATPQGTFPLKTFFSVALPASGDNGAGSASAVRYRIRQLVDNDPPDAPLSDHAIARIISDEGTSLARRTVAKYRGILNIQSSFQRRRRNVVAGLV